MRWDFGVAGRPARCSVSIRHPQNRGYGAALKTAFDHAIRLGYDRLVTIDCDGQHEPALIPKFLEAARHADIVSEAVT